MRLDALIRAHPRLYHMADAGAWPSIREHGLLSTTAILDRVGMRGPEREALEAARRPERVPIGGTAFVLRDQKPLNEAMLARALRGGLAPADWLRLLNGLVFFWASEARLATLLAARAYRDRAHDVLVVDTARLLARHAARVRLASMNTGSTPRYPAPRDASTFMTIDAFPARARSGAPAREIVEVCVEHAVPDIAELVLEVRRMRAGGDAAPA